MQGYSNHLRDALEVASGINRFMLRAEFGTAIDARDVLRSDLNRLADVDRSRHIPQLLNTPAPRDSADWSLNHKELPDWRPFAVNGATAVL
jgi:hypothetical protein